MSEHDATDEPMEPEDGGPEVDEGGQKGLYDPIQQEREITRLREENARRLEELALYKAQEALRSEQAVQPKPSLDINKLRTLTEEERAKFYEDPQVILDKVWEGMGFFAGSVNSEFETLKNQLKGVSPEMQEYKADIQKLKQTPEFEGFDDDALLRIAKFNKKSAPTQETPDIDAQFPKTGAPPSRGRRKEVTKQSHAHIWEQCLEKSKKTVSDRDPDMEKAERMWNRFVKKMKEVR